MAEERYTYIWEYEVPASTEAESLLHYAPDGALGPAVPAFVRTPCH